MLVACGLARGNELADFGVAPTRDLRLANYAAPTPREVPGARTIHTRQLQTWLRRDAPMRPVLLDVVGGEGHESIPGAVWLPGAGRGQGFNDAVQGQLARALQVLTGGSLARPIVFFCAGSIAGFRIMRRCVPQSSATRRSTGIVAESRLGLRQGRPQSNAKKLARTPGVRRQEGRPELDVKFKL